MSDPTVAAYERSAAEYLTRRRGRKPEAAARFGRSVRPGGVRLDAGCGPGIDAGALAQPLVMVDAAAAMVALARDRHPGTPAVQAALSALPFRRGALAGTWARCSYHHLPRAELPGALADLHRCSEVGSPLELTVVEGADDGWTPADDDFPGRFFAAWDAPSLVDVVEGAGFVVEETAAPSGTVTVRARRARTLADTVDDGMRVLVCGLNPSLHAADAGVGYAGPGNRFWPAAVEAGLAPRRLDAVAALRWGTGMTDLVKRATARAADVTRAEFRDGAARVERLARWLSPGAVCFVGLTGYRLAVDRGATAGWQDEGFGGVPTYVMPSTSGLNTHATYADLVAHLRVVRAGPGTTVGGA